MKNTFQFLLSCAALVGIWPASAGAHFVWVAVKTEANKPTAQVYFSELAEPGEANLIEKVAKVDVKATRGEKATSLKFTEKKDGEYGALVSELTETPAALTAQLDYGVRSRENSAFRLYYFARYADLSQPFTPGAEVLPLDVQPRVTGESLELAVLVDGRPAPAGLEVVAAPLRGEPIKGATNAEGKFSLGAPGSGTWSIRVKQTLPQAGERDGEKYTEVRRYATLTLRTATAAGDTAPATTVAPSPAAETATPEAKAEGAKLLKAARSARAAWHNFPGFKAKLALRSGDAADSGTLTVTADGKVTLEGFKQEHKDVSGMIGSLVSHRLPDNEVPGNGVLVSEPASHPLGQLVRLENDTAMASAYRVEGDVIRQVNRSMGGGKFTISVLDVARNAENKYLPSVYTVSFWNSDGSLKSTSTVHEDYVRVGSFDLPARRLSVTAGKDAATYSELVFTEHELIGAAK